MTTEVITQLLQAGVQATFGQGRIWYLKSASSAVTITCEQRRSGAAIRKFTNVAAGFKFKAAEDDGWSYLRLTSALAQTIEIIIGDDDVEVANAVTVSGGVLVSETPSSTIITAANDIAINAATTDAASVPANGARRRVTIGVLSTAAGPIRVSANGVTLRGIEIQPGQFVEFRTTAALGIRNDGAAATSFYVFEET